MSEEKTALEIAAEHCLAAVREMRAYVKREAMEPDDLHLKFCQSTIRSLQRLADRLDPPRENWPDKVVPFVPGSRKRGGE